jgi:hypothetical protein
VTIVSSAADGFVVHSHAGDDWKSCRAYVRERLGLPSWQPGAGRETSPALRERPPLRSHEGPSDEERTARAMRIWSEATAPTGTLVEAYLAVRGLHLPDDVVAADALRFHPTCPFGRERHPAMVALFTDAVTGAPKGVHRTALSPEGRKLERKSLGPIAGCVIRLWPDEMVEQGLVLGEGIETTLAAAQVEHQGTLLQPAWATGSAGNIASFPVLAGIDAITILVDHDASGTGQRAAQDCSERWTEAGREVTRLVPHGVGTDFADIAGVLP